MWKRARLRAGTADWRDHHFRHAPGDVRPAVTTHDPALGDSGFGVQLRRFASGWIPRKRSDDAERAEGKIKEDGTMLDRFWKLLLSAQWLGHRFRHHGFEGRRAAISCKALVLQGFERHYRPISACFGRFRPKLDMRANVDTEMIESNALPFHAAADGETVSGKFAVVVKSHEFTLVP
jgi:hypothetical protein